MSEPNHYHGPMYTYEVGNFFPFPELIEGDKPLLITCDRGLILTLISGDPVIESNLLATTEMIVSLVEPVSTMPFIILAFDRVGYYVDYFLNAKKITEEGAAEFLKGPADQALILICGLEGLIYHMRAVAIPPELAHRLKEHVVRMRADEHTAQEHHQQALIMQAFMNPKDLFRLGMTQFPPEMVAYDKGDD